MGARKREMANAIKEQMKKTAIAKLNDHPTSPRKMRLVADIIRGKEVGADFKVHPYSKCNAFGETFTLCHRKLAS